MKDLLIEKGLIKFKYNIRSKNKTNFFDCIKSLPSITETPVYTMAIPVNPNSRKQEIIDQDNFDNIELYFNYNNQSLRFYYSQRKLPYNNSKIIFYCDCELEKNLMLLDSFTALFKDFNIEKNFNYKLIYSDLSNYYSKNLFYKMLKYETSLREMIWTLLMFKYEKKDLQSIIKKVGFDKDSVAFTDINKTKSELTYNFLQELCFSEYSTLLCTPFILNNELDTELNNYSYNKEKNIVINDIKKIFKGKSLLERFSVFSSSEIELIKTNLNNLTKHRNTIMHCKQLSYKQYIEIDGAITTSYPFIKYKTMLINNEEPFTILENFDEEIIRLNDSV